MEKRDIKRITNIPISEYNGFYWLNEKNEYCMGSKTDITYPIKSSEYEIADRNIKAIKYLEKKGYKTLIQKKGKRCFY